MIDAFMGENRWLSNFGDGDVWYNGRLYKNRESAYQDAKLTGQRPALDSYVSNGAIEDLRSKYLTTSGKEAKAFSKTVKHLTRPDWEEVNLAIMSEIVHAFFTQHKDERIKLVLTYPQELIEGNTWHDTFYGVCKCQGTTCFKGSGKNWLGRIEMAERVYWLDMMSNCPRERSNEPTTVAA